MTGLGQDSGLYATRRDLNRRGRQLTFDAQMRVDMLKQKEAELAAKKEEAGLDIALRQRTEDRLAQGQAFTMQEAAAAREEKRLLDQEKQDFELLKFKTDKKQWLIEFKQKMKEEGLSKTKAEAETKEQIRQFNAREQRMSEADAKRLAQQAEQFSKQLQAGKEEAAAAREQWLAGLGFKAAEGQAGRESKERIAGARLTSKKNADYGKAFDDAEAKLDSYTEKLIKAKTAGNDELVDYYEKQITKQQAKVEALDALPDEEPAAGAKPATAPKTGAPAQGASGPKPGDYSTGAPKVAKPMPPEQERATLPIAPKVAKPTTPEQERATLSNAQTDELFSDSAPSPVQQRIEETKTAAAKKTGTTTATAVAPNVDSVAQIKEGLARPAIQQESRLAAPGMQSISAPRASLVKPPPEIPAGMSLVGTPGLERGFAGKDAYWDKVAPVTVDPVEEAVAKETAAFDATHGVPNVAAPAPAAGQSDEGMRAMNPNTIVDTSKLSPELQQKYKQFYDAREGQVKDMGIKSDGSTAAYTHGQFNSWLNKQNNAPLTKQAPPAPAAASPLTRAPQPIRQPEGMSPASLRYYEQQVKTYGPQSPQTPGDKLIAAEYAKVRAEQEKKRLAELAAEQARLAREQTR
jgi:hypothetical protein